LRERRDVNVMAIEREWDGRLRGDESEERIRTHTERPLREMGIKIFITITRKGKAVKPEKKHSA
jgi:hypothetical protein